MQRVERSKKGRGCSAEAPGDAGEELGGAMGDWWWWRKSKRLSMMFLSGSQGSVVRDVTGQLEVQGREEASDETDIAQAQ
jgi:hypothetical protein